MNVIEIFKSELNRVAGRPIEWNSLSMLEKRQYAATVVEARGGQRNREISMSISMAIPQFNWFVVSDDTVGVGTRPQEQTNLGILTET